MYVQNNKRQAPHQKPMSGNVVGTNSLRKVDIESVIFVNIESVPELPEYDDLSTTMQRLWDETSASLATEGQSGADIYRKAGIFAEFGKAVCISAGVVRMKNGVPYFITQSYTSDDEREVLDTFAGMIDNAATPSQNIYLCGHGIRRHDVPFFAKRMLVNNLQLPVIFDPNGRKPLTASIIDTADFWAFTDLAGGRVSAELLTNVFGISTDDKDYDIEECAHLLYDNHDINAIVSRSERKVWAVAQLMRRFRGEEIIPAERIISKKDNMQEHN